MNCFVDNLEFVEMNETNGRVEDMEERIEMRIFKKLVEIVRWEVECQLGMHKIEVDTEEIVAHKKNSPIDGQRDIETKRRQATS
ncbi:hypothetical protein HHI36_017160 [Cryptolaemus montrouzieri]|uniref:Uncharacterized protein n=1 Tax=Cryptolaemus montrouzieri TaxID=559131 RepID=A0ABD2NLZ0_9CUCU